MWPEVPANTKSLSASELRDLARSIKAVALEMLKNPELSAEDRSVTAEKMTQREELIALAHEKDAATAAAAALEADDSDAEPVVEPVVEIEVADAEPVVEPVVEPVAAAEIAKVPTTFGVAAKASGNPPTKAPKLTVDYLTAVSGVAGKDPGEGFDSWQELAAAAITKSNTIRANSAERFEVARIVADYPKERILTDDINFNLARFEPDELMAALCAPATPYYNLACMNTLRRPVFASLPQFQAPRMKVSIYPSPALSDITTGVDIWTAANEASSNATKSTCQTITCGNSTEYSMYGIYKCLTVRNMLAMSFPELVEAYLNRLGALHSRTAEIQLLELMATGVTNTIDAAQLGYGATTSITTTVLQYIALYQETQRWDITDNMEGWLPRWVQTGIKIDLMRRRTTNGAVQAVPSDAQIDAMFRDVGVNIHWYIDHPSWNVALPSVGTVTLNNLPGSVQMLIAPPGKFAVMDRGELAIGVTGNGMYRDNTSNSRNEFTFFFENFEGVVNTTNCPAHILDIPCCWNGVQQSDQLTNCNGIDEVGFQS